MPLLGNAPRLPVLAGSAALAALSIQLLVPQPAPTAPSPRTLKRSALSPAATGAALRLTDVPSYPELDARALFGGVAQGPAAQTEALTLVGIAQAGRIASAIVRDGSGASHFLRSGDRVSGWTVLSVSGERVELARGGERRTLGLGDSPPATGPVSR